METAVLMCSGESCFRQRDAGIPRNSAWRPDRSPNEIKVMYKISDPFQGLEVELLAYVTHKSTRNALSLCSYTSYKSVCFFAIRFG